MSLDHDDDIFEINIKNINNKYDVYLNKNNINSIEYEGKNLLTKEKITIDIYNHDIILLAKRIKNNIIKINHPNIVNIIDIIIETNKIYIIRPKILKITDAITKLTDINTKTKIFQSLFNSLFNSMKYLFDKNINIEPLTLHNIYIDPNDDNNIKIFPIFSPYKNQNKILYGSPLLNSPQINSPSDLCNKAIIDQEIKNKLIIKENEIYKNLNIISYELLLIHPELNNKLEYKLEYKLKYKLQSKINKLEYKLDSDVNDDIFVMEI